MQLNVQNFLNFRPKNSKLKQFQNFFWISSFAEIDGSVTFLLFDLES